MLVNKIYKQAPGQFQDCSRTVPGLLTDLFQDLLQDLLQEHLLAVSPVSCLQVNVYLN